MPRVTTEKQKEAARRNGARSHGPKTLAGKLRIAARSFKHGRYARLNVRPEDAESFRAVHDSLVNTIQPAGEAEAALVNAIAAAEWRLVRLFTLDRNVISDPSPAGRARQLRYLGALESRLVVRRAKLLRRLADLEKIAKRVEKAQQPVINEQVTGNFSPFNEPETNPGCD